MGVPILFYLLSLSVLSIEAGAPFDKIYFASYSVADLSKLHLCARSKDHKIYLARLTMENGDQIVGNYYADTKYDSVYFSWNGKMRYIPTRTFKEYKVEFLQHTTNGGISWYFTHKRFTDDFGKNFTVHIGKLHTGEKVYVCRGIINEKQLFLGRHIENQEGCILHGMAPNYLDYFEIMGVNFLGQHEGGKRILTSTHDYKL